MNLDTQCPKCGYGDVITEMLIGGKPSRWYRCGKCGYQWFVHPYKSGRLGYMEIAPFTRRAYNMRILPNGTAEVVPGSETITRQRPDGTWETVPAPTAKGDAQ